MVCDAEAAGWGEGLWRPYPEPVWWLPNRHLLAKTAISRAIALANLAQLLFVEARPP
jgi:hypothetical protein